MTAEHPDKPKGNQNMTTTALYLTAIFFTNQIIKSAAFTLGMYRLFKKHPNLLHKSMARTLTKFFIEGVINYRTTIDGGYFTYNGWYKFEIKQID